MARIELRDHEEEDELEVCSKWYFYLGKTGWKRGVGVIWGFKFWRAAFMTVENVLISKILG